MHNNKIFRFTVFVSFNYLALGIGVLLMNNGPQTLWYTSLNQAPWTPANWVFGVAWSLIMFCFSFYMTKLSFNFNFLNKQLLFLYSCQWFLNVSWNYIFFNKNLILSGLLIIILLGLLIGYFFFNYSKKMKAYSLLILPYLIWIIIAVSLNAYIYFYN